MTQCLTDSDLNRYHAGELDEADEARVREHLAECETCAQRDAELVAQHEEIPDRVKGMKRSEAPGDQPGPTRTRRRARDGQGRGAERTPGQMIGRFIGPYKLLEILGEGGFGVVYLAEQVEPVRRRVALKIIKPGMDSQAVIARFEAEQQALAMMDHPHVAKVFDAGMTEGGRSYFVMEHVQGIAITDYCDRNRLSTNERLELFMQVCHAVQHAHQKGIIHRDIKPSNVLVAVQDGAAVPKVIDFGVAKATQQRLTESTLFTEQGQLIGTPGYMSPEQAEMSALDIDTRTDIYSLGVLLYELLVGARPFDDESLREAGLAEIQRIIREVEPPKPSTRLSSLGESSTQVAHKRRTEIHKLSRLLRGDLDWVTMKALEKDRTRRYDSASDLAADIARHLNHEPVVAGPPSVTYRAKKFIRRNQGMVTAAVVVFLVLIVGIVVATHQRNRAVTAEREQSLAREGAVQSEQVAIAERDKAATARQAERQQRKIAEQREKEAVEARAETQKRADELEIVTEFQSSMLSEIDAEEMGLALFADLRSRVRESLEAEQVSPEDIDSALDTFDQTLRRANATNAALKLIDEQVLSRAVKAIEKDFADQPLVRTALEQTVADTYRRIGLYEPAMPLQQEALKTRRRILGDDHPDTLNSINNLGVLLRSMGKLGEAEPYYREALQGRRRVLGDEDPYTLASINNLGMLLRSMGQLHEAEPYFREALEGCRRVLGDDHPDTLNSINNMGFQLQAMGKHAEAEPYYREALEGKRRVLGDDHPDTLTSISSMGGLLESMGKFGEAEPYWREALHARRRVLGDDHPDTLRSINNMGGLLQSMGKLSEAEPYYREAMEGHRRVLGDDHPSTLVSINNMGLLLKLMGKLAEAEPYVREALEGYRRVLGNEHADTLRAINNMGLLLKSMGKLAEAEPYYREALEGCRRVLGKDHPRTLTPINNMGALLQSMGKFEEAEPYLREALEGRRSHLGDDHPDTLTSISNMGVLLQSMGKLAEAEPYYREALAGSRRVLGDDHPGTLISIHNMGRLLRDLGRLEEAEALGADAVRGARAKLAPSHPFRLAALAQYGRTLAAMQRFTEAEAELLEAYEGFVESLGPDHRRTTGAAQGLADLYAAWHTAEPDAGYDAKAAEWRAKLPAEATSQPAE